MGGKAEAGPPEGNPASALGARKQPRIYAPSANVGNVVLHVNERRACRVPFVRHRAPDPVFAARLDFAQPAAGILDATETIRGVGQPGGDRIYVPGDVAPGDRRRNEEDAGKRTPLAVENLDQGGKIPVITGEHDPPLVCRKRQDRGVIFESAALPTDGGNMRDVDAVRGQEVEGRA